jgi:hypothetical protein
MQPSEKRLLLILCAALFLALNLLGLRFLMLSRKRLDGGIASANAAISEDRSLIEAGKALRPAVDWIKEHPMPRLAPDDASAGLLREERDAAEAAGLKVTEENLSSPGETAYGRTAGVSVKLSGPFPGVVKFLFRIQSPGAWRMVEKLALRSDSQPPNVLADIEIRQYFQTPAPAPSTP